MGRGFWGESQARWATFWGSSRCWRGPGTEASLGVRKTWGPDPVSPAGVGARPMGCHGGETVVQEKHDCPPASNPLSPACVGLSQSPRNNASLRPIALS